MVQYLPDSMFHLILYSWIFSSRFGLSCKLFDFVFVGFDVQLLLYFWVFLWRFDLSCTCCGSVFAGIYVPFDFALLDLQFEVWLELQIIGFCVCWIRCPIVVVLLGLSLES